MQITESKQGSSWDFQGGGWGSELEDTDQTLEMFKFWNLCSNRAHWFKTYWQENMIYNPKMWLSDDKSSDSYW